METERPGRGKLSCMRMRQAYSTDVTDVEWHILEPLVPAQRQRGRKITYQRREIVNAIFSPPPQRVYVAEFTSRSATVQDGFPLLSNVAA